MAEVQGRRNAPSPCPACPIHSWVSIREGTEAERAIRADEQRLVEREREAFRKDRARYEERIEGLQAQIRALKAKASERKAA